MRYSTLIGSLLLVLLAMTAFGGVFINQVNNNPNYDVQVSQDFQGLYTNITVLSNLVENTTGIGLNMSDQGRTAKQLQGDYEDASKTQIKTTKIMWSSFSIIKQLVLNTSEILHIPPIIVMVILSSLVFALMFGFISLIFRWRA